MQKGLTWGADYLLIVTANALTLVHAYSGRPVPTK